MRKLWKTTATLAAAVLLAGSLAGCGSSSSFGGTKSGSTSDMIVTTMNTGRKPGQRRRERFMVVVLR